MDRYQPRFNSQGQFRPATGPPQFGRFDYRGTFQGPVPRPMPIYPHESHLGEFRPVYNHSLDPRGGFLCPPRARQSFHHEGKYEEFTPPRPFHGWNKGHRQNSSNSIGRGGRQRPEFKKGSTQFNSHKYFKDSMLEDPWKELTEKKKLEQITNNTLS